MPPTVSQQDHAWMTRWRPAGDGGGNAGSLLASTAIWADLAARLLEAADVRQQPKMLQGGQLRPYQMQVRLQGGWCSTNPFHKRAAARAAFDRRQATSRQHSDTSVAPFWGEGQH